MEAVNSTNGIRKEIVRSAIKAEKLYSNEFQKKGTVTAQIRQTVTTKSFYPSAKISSNMQDNLFGAAEFGFEDKVFETEETRVTWILVPENSTLEAVQARLEAAYKNGACIYKALSAQPILDENQKYAVNAGLRTMDDFADAQAVRYPENETTIADGTANKLILDKAGNVQYRRTFFYKTPQDDFDVRGQVVPYLSAKLKAELVGASVMEGQTI